MMLGSYREIVASCVQSWCISICFYFSSVRRKVSVRNLCFIMQLQMITCIEQTNVLLNLLTLSFEILITVLVELHIL